MNLRIDRCWLKCLLCGCSLLFGTQDAGAASVLFIGQNAGPTFGDDGAVFAHLQTLFDEATYIQDAASSSASADGFDALVISSTSNSGNVRGKFENSTVGILNWEPAYMDCRAGTAGQLCLSSGGSAEAGTLISEITIVDPAHPLAAGLSGTVEIFSSPQRSTTGAGDLGDPEQLVAESTVNPLRYAIWGIDVGEPLAGDGSAGRPNIAAGRRASFPLFDDTFLDLTGQGLELFDAAAKWVANILGPPPIPGDTNGNMIPGEFPEDFDPIRDNFRMNVTSREQGDLVRNGFVDFADFKEWKTAFLGGGGSLAGLDLGFLTTSVPEPSTGVLLLAAGLAAACVRKRRLAA